MEQSATPLKAILGLFAVAMVGFLGVLILQAAKPTIKNPQPLNGATAPKGDVVVGAEITGEADLREVRLTVDGQAVQPVIVSHSQRRWGVSYKAGLARGTHHAEVVAVDQRGREQSYRWTFVATGPAVTPKFANPLPRQGARLVAGEALISLATFSEQGEAIKGLALQLNGRPLISVEGKTSPGERTVANQRRALTPGEYTVRAEATDSADTTGSYEWKFTVVDPERGDADARFFPETGHYVYSPFYDYWAKHGGLALYGLPITPDFEDKGLTVQWFERARFERQPGSGQVQLGQLGRELRQPDPRLPSSPSPDFRFFAETGHSLRGAFRDYWERNGGLEQFGFPLTEELNENGLTVQWFERARFEYHPERAGAPDEVQLSQLGRTLWQREGRR